MSEGTLAMDGAIKRVAGGLYGGDWIGELGERERWLIERYIDGSRRDRGSTILPGEISHVVGGRQWAEVPGDPALMAEVDRARDRRDWMEAQYEAVFDWLETRGFDLDSDRIDKAGFEKVFAACFKGGAAVRRSPSDASKSSGPAAPPSAAEPIYRTGVAGRPTAWHLVAGECRRRYAAGERHPKALTGRESPSEWAPVLIKWLGANHPDAPAITKKTLSNKLPALFRELAADTLP